MSKIRECCVCGSSYTFCPNCDRDPSWKTIYDTEVCREIGNVVSAYNMKIMNKQKAKDALAGLNIKNPSSYKENIAQVLTEIIDSDEPKPKRRRRKKQ